MTGDGAQLMEAAALPAAVRAFDAIAPRFEERYGAWASVAAQRRAVRRILLRAFPPESRLLELGGGTGTDAVFLAQRQRRVVLTDGAPAMVAEAERTVRRAGLQGRIEIRQTTLEQLAALADELAPAGPAFDGAYSNFAALNCVADLAPVGHALARMLPAGATAVLVVFGTLSIGEMVVQLARVKPRSAFRRLARGDVAASIGGRQFAVRYPSPSDVARAFAPYFRLTGIRGIGIFVPPSAAEPAISRFPRLLGVLEALDRLASAPFARLGDHLLLRFERTAVRASRSTR